MELLNIVSKMDGMILQGQIPQAVEQFFATNAVTKDFDGTETKNKTEMLQKMDVFLGGIQQVNGITLHHAAVNDRVSMSEFTFDFDMKDGSQILWHEIIRREWQNGKVVNEQYFKN